MSAEPVTKNILALDCALEACSAGLFFDDRHILKTEDMTRGQSERLVPLIEELMKDQGCAYSQLDALAVTLGPGSFTGIRVGLASAVSIGEVLNIPVYGFSTFDVLAQQYKHEDGVVFAIDSKRGDMFAQNLKGGALDGETYLRPIEGIKQSANKIIGLCSDITVLPIDKSQFLNALIGLASQKLSCDEAPSAHLAPIYMRDADTSQSKTQYRSISENIKSKLS